MEYRKLPHGSENISILGMGTSSIGASGEKEIREALRLALENGINYFDMASADAAPFAAFGKELGSARKNVYFQIHFGADYSSGEYGWSTDLETIKRSVDWQLKNLQTDYIDFGFIHCIDEAADWETIQSNGVLEYLYACKKQGMVRHIGLSSHTPVVVNRILNMLVPDMLMFSINPGYDYRHGEFAVGSADERMQLYQRCEKEGVGISVMKAFSGGQLLDAATSPFRHALTETQCIQYALDKPGVLTVLPGVRNREDLKKVLTYFDTTPDERDYSALGGWIPRADAGRCVYCNHCQPCPAGLNIGLINKYYDLARAGDSLAVTHYQTLEKKAADCISCNHCNRRCPFHVDQAARMRQIAAYFGGK